MNGSKVINTYIDKPELLNVNYETSPMQSEEKFRMCTHNLNQTTGGPPWGFQSEAKFWLMLFGMT